MQALHENRAQSKERQIRALFTLLEHDAQPMKEISSKRAPESNQGGVIFTTDSRHLF